MKKIAFIFVSLLVLVAIFSAGCAHSEYREHRSQHVISEQPIVE